MNISQIKLFPKLKYFPKITKHTKKNCSMNISEIKIFSTNYNSFNYPTFKYTQFQLQNSIYPTDLKNCSMNISEIKIFSTNYNSFNYLHAFSSLVVKCLHGSLWVVSAGLHEWSLQVVSVGGLCRSLQVSVGGLMAGGKAND